MKNIFLPLFFLLISFGVAAQPEHKVAVDGKTIVFEEIDNLVLIGYDGKDLKIGRQSGHDQRVDERSKGLRKISAGGMQDNTGFGLNAQVRNGEVVVSQVGRGDGIIQVQVPNSSIVRVEQSTHKGGDLMVSNFKGELDVSMHYHQVKLTNAYGPLSVNTIYGGITATFSDGPPTKDIRLHSTYKDVDITLPRNTKANLRLYTGYGDMYTDFDVEVMASEQLSAGAENGEAGKDPDDCNCKDDGNDGLNGKINGGGKLISLTASYKNIYLRQL
ncbi:MAG: hypothetical protein AAF597_00720 [Bacteroidota bacterium]